jgi:hypothetical protein
VTSTPTNRKQHADLCKPFPPNYIEQDPHTKASYVAHHIVTQRLLTAVGPFDLSVVEVLRGQVPGTPPNPRGQSDRAKKGTPDLENVVVGVICRLGCTIDDRYVTVEEVGDCEAPHNWKHDGQRMKDAMSDALKRCAMRLGVGLHLWAQEHFYLDRFYASYYDNEKRDE